MFDKHLRPLKDRVLRSTANKIAGILNPNQITLISFSLGLLSCYFIFSGQMNLALLFWILNRITDGLDGTVARVSNRQSNWGGYLDLMLDFIIYAAIPISLTIVYNTGALSYPALSLMLAVFYINSASWMYLSALQGSSETNNKKDNLTSIPMPTGLVEGSETVFFYILFYLFPLSLPPLFFIVSGLTVIGIIQRFVWGYRNLRD